MTIRRFALALLVAGVLTGGAALADPPTHETGYVPVAVGTDEEALLHYKVILPDPEIWGPGPYPAVMDFSGYEPAITIWDGLDDRFHAAGYAVVGLNMRGSSCSGGSADFFTPRQSKDGAEAIDWLAENREWSNGRFAMVGKSFPGVSQLFVASEHPAHLEAIVPGHILADLYRDVGYPGGIENTSFAAGWSVQRFGETFLVGPQYAFGSDDPAASDDVKRQCLENQTLHPVNAVYNPITHAFVNQFDGAFYQIRSAENLAHLIEVPTLVVQSWQDEQTAARALHMIERFDPDLRWRLVVTNGDHGEYYGNDVFPKILRFVHYHLRKEVPPGDPCDAGLPDPRANYAASLTCFESEDRVEILWENGGEPNPQDGTLGGRFTRWTSTHADWPPPEQALWRLHLTAEGGLVEDAPAPPDLEERLPSEIVEGRLRENVDYLYLPEVGSQQRGGFSLVGEPGATWADRPPDGTHATFTTPPLPEDKVLAGSASLDLWITSTAPDTDFEVTISEVRPDGQEMFVQQGWLRASRRREDSTRSTGLRPYQTHRMTDVSLLVPGQPTQVRIEIFPFGHVFRAGSRLRITVAAPHVAPDLWGFGPIPVPAVNTIFTSALFPSSVALPLLAGRSAEVASFPPCTLRNQPCRPEE